MTLRYNPSLISRFFDEYGEREWNRLAAEAPAMDRVNLETHRALLREFVRSGDRVLEVGAGPGRFTIELAELGARVVVADVSRGQLDLHREKLAAAGAEAAVEARVLADVVELSQFAAEEFDVGVCIGGPLSYVCDRAADGLRELLRVTRPGGHVVLSVMSKLGAARRYAPALFELWDEFGLDATQAVVDTGDLSAEINAGQQMHMFTWAELRKLLEDESCTIVAASAANFLSARNDDVLDRLPEERWHAFLRWELACCREPGALDGGTHIIAVVRRD
jgi:SAM-dependent methyltransferase